MNKEQERQRYEQHCANRLKIPFEELKERFDGHEKAVGYRYSPNGQFAQDWNLWQARAKLDSITPSNWWELEFIDKTIGLIIRDMCELDGRSSPEDNSDAMIVTTSEMKMILDRHLKKEG